MTFPVVYDAATDHTTGPTPGAQALMAWALATYPPGTNLGIWVPRPQRGTTTPSVHWCGRAIDVGYHDLRNTPANPNRSPSGRNLAALRLTTDLLLHHADLGLQCVIYAGEIWSTRQPTWHAYTGVEQHWGHVHIELTRQAGQQLTAARIAAAFNPPAPTPQGDPMALYRLAQDRLTIDCAYDGFYGPEELSPTDQQWAAGGRRYWYRVATYLRLVHRNDPDGGDAPVESAMAEMCSALGAGAEPK